MPLNFFVGVKRAATFFISEMFSWKSCEPVQYHADATCEPLAVLDNLLSKEVVEFLLSSPPKRFSRGGWISIGQG